MKAFLAAVGAAILTLGFALILLAPTFSSSALFQAEANAFGNGANITSLASAYKGAAAIVNQAEWIAIAGAILAPIGGGILVYGLATKPKDTSLEPTPAGMTGA